ncbi:Spo0E family sporulation regulatory protein-aspartic acid phosphatase [Paenibacillus sp. LMG 31461]|uniref:Spo0E family sporulation regulatory protein-aspartic acid phosphatase n=1 Tax=Paenibacillus plantarum TaxID=2654975 RepID=A0ABX1X2L5_9BACL|nr:aspartyl-phosphate phosphatase Spo0E family protein [Paenibacillus plantarum]NOU62653.1 Spo0E family sporulation regulatory protein-aspartic acid phosphatase [Paenibacillus plantarum]
MERLTQIVLEIERIRNEMHQASDKYGLESRMVLQKSKELDALLYELQKWMWLHKR